MKIHEVINEDIQPGVLSGHFKDENDFKRQLTQMTDMLCAGYGKTHRRVQGMAEFSNEIGNKMREHLTKVITGHFKITKPNDIAHVKSLVDNFISDKYLEYKINDIAPEEEYEHSKFYK